MATIMFMDIVEYTNMSRVTEPVTVMAFLQTLFNRPDALCPHFRVHKLETAGDCYIVCAGIVKGDPPKIVEQGQTDPVQDCRDVFGFAKEALVLTRKMLMPDGSRTRIRIGLHAGPCSSGLIGVLNPKFAVFGSTMNVASRLESASRPGAIHMSDVAYGLLKECLDKDTDGIVFKNGGGINVKGIGIMETFMWRWLYGFGSP